MSKVKILHIVNQMNYGGVEALLMNIYRNINREKFEFHFAVCFQGNYDEEIINLGGKIHILPHPSTGLVNYLKAFTSLIKKEQYHVLHSHVFYFSGFLMPIAKKEKIPIRIVHSHTTHVNQNGIKRKIYNHLMNLSIQKYSTNLLGCSTDACLALFNKTPITNDKLIIFPNAIELNKFQSVILTKDEAKKSFNIDPQCKVIGHVGRFVESKNHIRIIEIFSELLKSNPSSVLILVGDGPELSNIEYEVQKRNLDKQVFFLGARSDIPTIMKSFDVFLFPSIYEGLGIVLIEAQAAGIPCIASSVVPKEVDMKLNLLEFISLDSNNDVWSRAIEKYLSANLEIHWETREKAIKSQNYDIESLITLIEKIYTSEF